MFILLGLFYFFIWMLPTLALIYIALFVFEPKNYNMIFLDSLLVVLITELVMIFVFTLIFPSVNAVILPLLALGWLILSITKSKNYKRAVFHSLVIIGIFIATIYISLDLQDIFAGRKDHTGRIHGELFWIDVHQLLFSHPTWLVIGLLGFLNSTTLGFKDISYSWWISIGSKIFALLAWIYWIYWFSTNDAETIIRAFSHEGIHSYTFSGYGFWGIISFWVIGSFATAVTVWMKLHSRLMTILLFLFSLLIGILFAYNAVIFGLPRL